MAINQPVTRTIISTTDFGIPVAQFINFWTPTPWTPITLMNGFSNQAGWTPASYRKIGDIVYMRATLAGTGSASVTAWVLPVGFRPPYPAELPCVGYNGSTRIAIDCIVYTNGNVQFDPVPSGSMGISAQFSTTANGA